LIRVVKWRAWYSNERLYWSEDIDWFDLPSRGVVAIRLVIDKIYESNGSLYAHLLIGADYYFQVEINKEIKYGMASDIAIYDGIGKIDGTRLILNSYPNAVIKYGEMVADEEFEVVVAQARSKDFD